MRSSLQRWLLRIRETPISKKSRLVAKGLGTFHNNPNEEPRACQQTSPRILMMAIPRYDLREKKKSARSI